MKTTFQLISSIALPIFLALAACTADEATDNPGAPADAIRFIATIDGNTAADVIDTRATINSDGSGAFENGDKFKLWATGSSGVSFHVGYTIGTTVLRWDEFNEIGNEGSLTFSGAYPENAGIDQNEKIDIKGADNLDLLIAPTVTVAKGESVRLAFRHVMHRLVVNLSGNALTEDELSVAEVQLSGDMYCAAIVDFTNATAFADNSYMYGDENPPTRRGATTTFILVPQDIRPYSEKITITAGGQELTYTFPATLPGNEGTPPDTPRRLQSGRTLTLNLAINTANRSAAASAKPSTRATTTDDAALTPECTGITVSAW